jgi:predicted transcriptional regulator
MVRSDRLRELVGKAGMVAAVGLEAYIALKRAGRIPDMFSVHERELSKLLFMVSTVVSSL